MSVLTKADLEEILAMLDDAPEYHHSGMGCGLEDRNIHNRYEAMQHGWDSAIERVYGEHVNPAIEALKAAIEKVDGNRFAAVAFSYFMDNGYFTVEEFSATDKNVAWERAYALQRRLQDTFNQTAITLLELGSAAIVPRRLTPWERITGRMMEGEK